MIEHCIVAALAVALLALINSRVQWHFHYTIRKAARRVNSGREENRHGVIPASRIPEQRAVPSRPYKSTPERIADRQEELVASALVNLGAGKKDALSAAQAAMAGCPTKDFDSQFRYALQLVRKAS